MKIELNENAFWLGVWITLAALIISITVAICITCYKDTENAFKYGYEETKLPGSFDKIWVKVK